MCSANLYAFAQVHTRNPDNLMQFEKMENDDFNGQLQIVMRT